MALLVQKFGGSSLATPEHIQRAAAIVAKAHEAGHQIVVIVSAMGGETDRLLTLAKNISQKPSPRECAALIATGEQVSTALMAMALLERGICACSYTGWQARIQTCSQYQKARIRAIDTQPIQTELSQGKVVVLAGFQGVDVKGNITTLGRGGSDTTAVAIAAALKADECQIYTDVDGVYTGDPRIVADAKRIEAITFAEMLELASLGAKVLQIRAVEFAGKYNVPLRVLSSTEQGTGTLISYQEDGTMEAPVVTGVACNRFETKLTLCGVPGCPSIASQVLEAMSDIGVNVDMILQHASALENATDFTFTVHKDEYTQALAVLDTLASKLQAQQVVGIENLAKLSIVGSGLKSHPEIASHMFHILNEKNIHPQLVTTSEIKISVIVDVAHADEGVQLLHAAFCQESLAPLLESKTTL